MIHIDEIPDIFKNPNVADSEEMNKLSQNAEDVIAGLRHNFIVATKESIIQMQHILNDVQNDETAQAQILPDSFFRMAHDIKGQGATFGYPILTDLGKDICDILRYKDSWTLSELNRIERDVADMGIVIQLSPDSESSVINEIQQRLKDK